MITRRARSSCLLALAALIVSACSSSAPITALRATVAPATTIATTTAAAVPAG